MDMDITYTSMADEILIMFAPIMPLQADEAAEVAAVLARVPVLVRAAGVRDVVKRILID